MFGLVGITGQRGEGKGGGAGGKAVGRGGRHEIHHDKVKVKRERYGGTVLI